MKRSPGSLVRRLLDWYQVHRRELPWREETDPYRIWVSEVMLQQTRVESVRLYYEPFLARFPDVSALADAPLGDVLAHWAGLGYYRRARLLHAAARRVVAEHGGVWPTDHAVILRLPGVGDYTAAAIASIAFDEPRAAMDGNALRVLARLAGERRDIRGASARRSLKAVGQKLAESTAPGERGDFTQALMELGATVCVPRAPKCEACPWVSSCEARAAGVEADLPLGKSSRAARTVTLSVVVARCEERILVRQRPADASIMPGFWELPSWEGQLESREDLGVLVAADSVRIGRFSHAITVTNYRCDVYEGVASGELADRCRWMSPEELGRVPLTTISTKALRLIARPLAPSPTGRESVLLRRTRREGPRDG